MVGDAESHAAEDASRREEAEPRNHADNLAYHAEKTLREVGDRLPPGLRSEVEGKIAAVRSALQNSDGYQMKSAMQELESALQRVGQEVYSHAGVGAEAGGDPQASGDDQTVEGEFREV